MPKSLSTNLVDDKTINILEKRVFAIVRYDFYG